MRTLFREANKPEPIEKVDRSGWIKWGDSNLYPQFLNSMFYDNPVHGGIVNQKVKFITAGGISIEGDCGRCGASCALTTVETTTSARARPSANCLIIILLLRKVFS